jgi:hypothetical protein
MSKALSKAMSTPCSFSVGVSGVAGERFGPAVAMIFSLPALAGSGRSD